MIGMFTRDQLLCDKGKQAAFVGHIIVVFVYKQINQNKFVIKPSQDSRHKIFV